MVLLSDTIITLTQNVFVMAVSEDVITKQNNCKVIINSIVSNAFKYDIMSPSLIPASNAFTYIGIQILPSLQ